jgi:hypothetical protein
MADGGANVEIQTSSFISNEAIQVYHDFRSQKFPEISLFPAGGHATSRAVLFLPLEEHM